MSDFRGGLAFDSVYFGWFPDPRGVCGRYSKRFDIKSPLVCLCRGHIRHYIVSLEHSWDEVYSWDEMSGPLALSGGPLKQTSRRWSPAVIFMCSPAERDHTGMNLATFKHLAHLGP